MVQTGPSLILKFKVMDTYSQKQAKTTESRKNIEFSTKSQKQTPYNTPLLIGVLASSIKSVHFTMEASLKFPLSL